MNSNQIADKIEDAVGEMFATFGSSELSPTEYSLFYNPEHHKSWFIVIYFKDNDTLRQTLKQGDCYHIYTFLLSEISKIPSLEFSISFESGNRPSEHTEITKAHGRLIAKTRSVLNAAKKNNQKVCAGCGHDFDKHQMMFYSDGENPTPKEGWIICPEENCNCFQTWGTNFKGSESNDKPRSYWESFKKLFK